jgi:hypothetical protein
MIKKIFLRNNFTSNLYTHYMPYSNEKRIELVNNHINKNIILFNSFIDKFHKLLSCKINYLLTYDQLYKILFNKYKYKILNLRFIPGF